MEPSKFQQMSEGFPLSRRKTKLRRHGGGVGLVVLASLMLGLILLAAWPAQAEERISNFSSAVVLDTAGTVDVTETIDIVAEGYQIKRGIYRDLPTILVNADRSRMRSDLKVLSVTRDGQNEPFSIETIGNGYKRIRIGDADVMLAYGPHRYTIRYTMTRMARFFADHDELYWNATGNFWVFPIEKAVATVTLPTGAEMQNLIAYTGRPGSQEQAVAITKQSDTDALFRSNRRLESGEGMSFAVSFQKGVVLPPTGGQAQLDWLSDHRDVILPSAAALLIFLYNFVAWTAVGRDPKKGTIIPLFHAPKGMSPALVHYVHKLGWGKNGWTAFTASIFNLGVKGLVRIDNSSSTLRVTALDATPSEPLPAGEQQSFDLISRKGTLSVDKSSGPEIEKTRAAFVAAIERDNRKVYFNNNLGYVLLGFLLSGLLLGGMVLGDMLSIAFAFVAFFAGVFVTVAFSVLRAALRRPVTGLIFAAIWAGILLFNVGGSFADIFTDLPIDPPFIGAITIVAIDLLFAFLMRAPTVEGRRIMDQIDGLKLYLDTAEKNRLNIVGEPPMTVERFESLLPYAIALGVEKPWSEHFEAELFRSGVSNSSATYAPLWYSGRSFSDRNFSSSVSNVAAAMSAAMIAAQPSSSSGSGFSSGGGGSGGGGGGGGGGGW
jgi:hypothetical protein